MVLTDELILFWSNRSSTFLKIYDPKI